LSFEVASRARNPPECARAYAIELGIELAGAVDGLLAFDRMENHVGIQQELLQCVPIPVDDVQAEVLQQGADLGQVIRVGIELGPLILGEHRGDQAASEKYDDYCYRSLPVHLRSSSHVSVWIRITAALGRRSA